MLTIRLARAGAKKRPFFHITVADSRRARDGKFIERVGHFNPTEDSLEINKERVDHWLSQGAQLSERVSVLLLQTQESEEESKKRLEKKKKKRLKKIAKKASIKEEAAAEEAPAEAAAEEAPAEEAPAEAAAEEAPAEEVKEDK